MLLMGSRPFSAPLRRGFLYTGCLTCVGGIFAVVTVDIPWEGRKMTEPTGDGYDRYRPPQEQPTRPMQPVEEQPTQSTQPVQEQPTQAMPPAQEQPTQTMPLQQPTQQFGQVPYQGPAQQPMGDAGQGAAAMPAPNGEEQGNVGGRHSGKGKKKPWYKRPWVWIVVAVVLILGLAFGQGGSKEASAPASSKSNQSAISQPSKETFDMQTLVGKKWDEASKTLADHHWTATDYTVQTDDGKTPILGGNWTVTAVSSDAKPVISLKHDTSTPQPSSTQPADPRESALEQKLSTSAALSACKQYGKQQYPYGFKTHDITGVIQDFTPKDDNTWFYKATADVTNQYGAKAKGLNYECTVTGTTAAPQVIEFNVY